MNYCVFTICFFTLMSLSKEENTENSTAAKWTAVSEESPALLAEPPTTEISENSSSDEERKIRTNRTQYSRMRIFDEKSTTTTPTAVVPVTEFDYWWFFTTPRRPFISYRDYPGKPGVAIWKEISPAVGKDGKRTKKTDPTAAGVSSCATWWQKTFTTSILFPLLAWPGVGGWT